ncbi:MAG: hypothetical protein KKH28_00050 [Elusimicrobia bacterium]|nr:hypothetical protein [Elusimicrobiota bacterium]
MKIKLSSKEIIANAMSKAESAIISLLLKTLGIVVVFFNRRENAEDNTCMSPDGWYAISWSENGLISLIMLGPHPTVVSFFTDPGPNYHIWSALFSKDMQRIIITNGDGSITTLSAVPDEGFQRRKVLTTEPWWGYSMPLPTCNIVEFIFQTSSAYWNHTDNPNAKSCWVLPTPFQLPPNAPADSDCDWDQWVYQNERFWDRTWRGAASRLG